MRSLTPSKKEALDKIIAYFNLNFGEKRESIGSVPIDAQFGLPGFGLQSNGSIDTYYGYMANIDLVFTTDNQQ